MTSLIWLALAAVLVGAILGFARWATLRGRRDEAKAAAQAMAQGNAGHCPVCSRHPGNGPCTCVSVCGHPDCVGDHTSMAGLTAADVRWLRKVSIKGDE